MAFAPPVDPPLGVFTHYYAQRPTTLVLKEKVFSGSQDDFLVRDLEGNVVVKVAGKIFSMRDRIVITDPQGNHLFTLHKKIMALHTTWKGEDANGNELFVLTRKIISFRTRMQTRFTNASTRQPICISLRSDLLAHDADLAIGEDGKGPVVTKIERKLWQKTEFLGKQTYHIHVPPGVDLALMVGICICYDEAKNEDKKREAL